MAIRTEQEEIELVRKRAEKGGAREVVVTTKYADGSVDSAITYYDERGSVVSTELTGTSGKLSHCDQCKYKAWTISAETGEILYCAVCDARSRANDFQTERDDARRHAADVTTERDASRAKITELGDRNIELGERNAKLSSEIEELKSRWAATKDSAKDAPPETQESTESSAKKPRRR